MIGVCYVYSKLGSGKGLGTSPILLGTRPTLTFLIHGNPTKTDTQSTSVPQGVLPFVLLGGGRNKTGGTDHESGVSVDFFRGTPQTPCHRDCGYTCTEKRVSIPRTITKLKSYFSIFPPPPSSILPLLPTFPPSFTPSLPPPFLSNFFLDGFLYPSLCSFKVKSRKGSSQPVPGYR